MRRLLLTAGGLGLLRPAPGTWGSLPPPTLALLVLVLAPGATAGLNAALAALAAAAALTCVLGGRWAEERFGRKDPPEVVADEVAGQCLPLLGLPWGDLGGFGGAAAIVALAFLAFRIFDIVKPPPARGLQRLPAGWGILADDLAAGLYAAAVTQIAARLVA